MRLCLSLADSGLVELLMKTLAVSRRPLHSPLQKLLGSFMSIHSPSTATNLRKAAIYREQ